MPHHPKNEIEDLIHKTGLSNGAIAAALQVSPNTVSRWKDQEAVPTSTWKKLEDLAKKPAKQDVGLASYSNELLIAELRKRLSGQQGSKKKTKKSSAKARAK